MNSQIKTSSCALCDGSVGDSRLSEYSQCDRCGHYSYVGDTDGGPVTNQAVDESASQQPTRLQVDQAKAVRSEFDGGVAVLDLGCGDGGFLSALRASAGPPFDRLVGVEVDPASLDHARSIRHLDVVTDVAQAGSGFSAATAWHSAEHFPLPQLRSALVELRSQLDSGGKVLIAVPNGASFQQRWFGSRWAFHDDPNHRSVFTPASLESLMRSAGFEPVSAVRLPRYGLFSAVQSAFNVFVRPHNALYEAMKRHSVRLDRRLILKHLVAAPFAGLIATPFMVAELSKYRAASLNVWFAPDPDWTPDTA